MCWFIPVFSKLIHASPPVAFLFSSFFLFLFHVIPSFLSMLPLSVSENDFPIYLFHAPVSCRRFQPDIFVQYITIKKRKKPPDISFFMFLRCPEVLFYLRRMFTFYSTSCSASVSSSPVRTFTTLSTLYTKILPSPICPVYRTFFAASMT